jgi:hypothetical protein
MPGDLVAIVADQNRIGKAEGANAAGDFRNRERNCPDSLLLV